MYRLTFALCIAGCIAAAGAASSIPIATQPLLSTSTVTDVTPELSTSLESFLSTSTVILYTTLTSQRKIVTSSIGQQLVVATSFSSVVATHPVTQLSVVVNTIGTTTVYSVLPSSNPLPTASSSIPPAAVVTSPSLTQSTLPLETVISTPSSTDLGQTAPAAITSAGSTISSSPSSKSSKKLSTGAAIGIAIGAATVIGALIGALVFAIGKRRRQQRWGREAVTDSPSGESKKNLFSPDAGAGYDSMWKKSAVTVETNEVRPGTATTADGRVSPVKHERNNSSVLGVDTASVGSTTPQTDAFGDKTLKPVPNFSTPTRRSGSLTALPYCK